VSTSFLIFCVVMVVAALALVLVPLLRNVPGEGKNKQPLARSVPLAVVLMIGLPLAATVFYGSTSNYPWNNPGLLGAAPGSHAQDGGSMDEVVTQLEERLRNNPGDLEGWRMLGRSYLVSNRFDQAVFAYDKASALTGGKDPEIELDLAEALVLTDKPESQEKAKGIIDAALAANDSNQKALWYSGVLAARVGDDETAKARFTKLLESNPPPQIREILVAQLEKLGAAVPAAEAATPPAGMGSMGSMGGGMGAGSGAATTPTGRTIRVSVSLDPALASRLKPGTPVFVSAREAGIPGPPIAAVRISSDELPTTVVLSDANSMIEGRTLSSVDEVQVVARVAFAGTPMQASGDLMGETRHRKGAAPELGLVIDKVIP
jgi:cytochrome c-type biogenesis protein CcmH